MKNFLHLIGGTSLAQLITIVASPLLSRIFSPEDFGNFAILTTLVYFFTAFVCLRLDFAILASSTENELKWLINKSISFLLLFSVFIAIFSLMYYQIQKENFIVALYLPLLVFISGLFNIFNNVTLKKQLSGLTAKSKVLQSGGGVLSQLLLGLSGFGFTGMAIGQILGFLYANYYMAKNIKPTLASGKKEYIGLFSFKKYKNYLIYDSLGSGLSVIANHLPTLLISLLLGKSFGGNYYMAYRVLLLPVSVISVSISQFVSSKFVTWKENSLYIRNLNQLLKLLSLLVFIPCSLLIFLLPDIFTIVLGKSWILAGQIASLCIFWVSLKFIFESFILAFLLNNNQLFGLYFQILLILFRFLSIYIAYYLNYNNLTIIKIFCISSAFIYLIGVLLIILVQRLNGKDFYKNLVFSIMVYIFGCLIKDYSIYLLYLFIIFIGIFWFTIFWKIFNQTKGIIYEN